MNDRSGASTGSGGDGVKTLGQIIRVDFQNRVRMPGRDDYLESADRLATAAVGQDEKTAASLNRLATVQRERAARF